MQDHSFRVRVSGYGIMRESGSLQLQIYLAFVVRGAGTSNPVECSSFRTAQTNHQSRNASTFGTWLAGLNSSTTLPRTADHFVPFEAVRRRSPARTFSRQAIKQTEARITVPPNITHMSVFSPNTNVPRSPAQTSCKNVAG